MEELKSIRIEEDAVGSIRLSVWLSGGYVSGMFWIGEPGHKTAYELERMALFIRREMQEREEGKK